MAALVNFLDSMRRDPGLAPDDRLVAVTTFSFDIAGLEIWLPLTTGGTVVLAASDDARDGRRLASIIARERATVGAGHAVDVAAASRIGLAEQRAPEDSRRRRGAARRSGARAHRRRAGVLEPLRSDRDDDLVHDPEDRRGARRGAHRPADRRDAHVCARRSPRARAVRRDRRSLHRRRRRRARLSASTRADRRAVRSRPARVSGRRAHVSHRRPGAPRRRRRARIRRPRRRSGEAARLPHRARRRGRGPVASSVDRALGLGHSLRPRRRAAARRVVRWARTAIGRSTRRPFASSCASASPST